MQTFMERVQALAASAVSDVEARNNIDRLLKSQNPNLYYSNLHIEYYYFCQQCENYFEIAGLLSHKHVPFATRFLKNRILNWWQ